MLFTSAVKPGKPVSCGKIDYPIRLANVALVSLGPFQTQSSLIISHGNKDYLLCTLTQSKSSQVMDLLFDEEDDVTFKVMDGGTFHLVGFEEPDDDWSDPDDDDGDSALAMERLAVSSRRSRMDRFLISRRNN